MQPRRVTLWVVLLLAGCGSASTSYYTLDPMSPATPLFGSHALRPPIEVAQIQLPGTIDRSSIVLDAGSDRLDVSANDAWGAPLDQTIRRTLSSDLSERLPAGSVLPPGTPAPSGGVQVLTVIIDRFIGDTNGRVILSVAWSITRSGATSSGPLHRERIETTARSGSVADVVPAMSKALAELANRIAITLT